jgi:hypothetical protein
MVVVCWPINGTLRSGMQFQPKCSAVTAFGLVLKYDRSASFSLSQEVTRHWIARFTRPNPRCTHISNL